MRAGERGSVALLLVVGLACGSMLVVQVGRMGAHAVARARAQTAADAAALAAADALALGKGAGEATEIAVRTAAANGATLRPADCACRGRVVTVTVTVRFHPMGPISAETGATARAEIRPILAPFAR